MESSKDAELIKAAAAGNKAAFETLWLKYVWIVRALVLKVRRSDDEVEDICQKVAYSVWRNLKYFRGEAKYTSWLHRVATNETLMFLRTKKCKREEFIVDLEVRGEKIPHPVANPIDDGFNTVARNQIFKKIKHTLKKLPKDYGHVMDIHFVHDYSDAETGLLLGRTTSMVKSKIHRARREFIRAFKRSLKRNEMETLIPKAANE